MTTKKTSIPPSRPRRTRKPLWDHRQIILFLLTISGLVTVCLGVALAWFLALDIPDIRSVNDYQPLVATTVLDRNGKVIDAIYKEYRIIRTFESLPPLVPAAFIAAEDSRYWEHGGLDSWSIFRAAVNNLLSGKRSQGGSTITQQVTRSLLLSREKSYFRKFTEAILAYRLDRMLSKQDVLGIYLNEIYLGGGAYGIEAAARTYFAKTTDQLLLSEIALLAGLPQAPSRYSPHKHFDRAKARQRYVLNRMAEENIITADEARRAYDQHLTLAPAGGDKGKNGYFSDYVRKQLASRYGQKALFYKGLTVSTTLDSHLQQAAVRTIVQGTQDLQKRQQAANPPQAALVALDSATGQILAMVGGTEYSTSPFNRAVMAQRQPGSVFKPLIYAAALEKGLPADSRFDDAPFSITNKNGTVWQPKNYTNTYHGSTSLSEALIYSRNIVTIKLLQKIGLQPVLSLAHKVGITSPLQPELTLALGASPVSLLEMTGAYTVFANQGMHHDPVCITSVRDHQGRVHPWSRASIRQSISPQTATTLTAILQQAVERGTGKNARGIREAAGKTGTSDNNRDAWFIGYTPAITAGVWLGYDRDEGLGKGETGGRAAAPVWKSFMQTIGN